MVPHFCRRRREYQSLVIIGPDHIIDNVDLAVLVSSNQRLGVPIHFSVQNCRFIQFLRACNEQSIVVIGLLFDKLLRASVTSSLTNDLGSLETLESSIVNLDFLDNAWLQDLCVGRRPNNL